LAHAGAINPPERGIGDKERGEEGVRGPYSRKSNSTPLHSALPQELVSLFELQFFIFLAFLPHGGGRVMVLLNKPLLSTKSDVVLCGYFFK